MAHECPQGFVGGTERDGPSIDGPVVARGRILWAGSCGVSRSLKGMPRGALRTTRGSNVLRPPPLAVLPRSASELRGSISYR